MTVGEWARVQAAAPDVPVVVQPCVDGRVEVARPDGAACAFYDGGCTVYAVRPAVCRAFGCFGGDGTMPGMLQRVRESAGVRRRVREMLAEAEAWTARCE